MTRSGGSFFPYLNITIFDFLNMAFLKLLIDIFINIIAYISLYKQVVYQMLNYKS